MRPGKILIEWDHGGKLNIKTSLPVGDSSGKQEALRILLDAAKAINESGTRLELPVGLAGACILGNN